MNRRPRSGGAATKKPKASAKRARRATGQVPRSRLRPEDTDPDAIDPDAPEYAGVDWEALPEAHFSLDPALVERIRARHALKQITLRIGEEQIAEARRVAAKTGTPYQAVLRRWLAEGASRARIQRMQAKRAAAR